MVVTPLGEQPFGKPRRRWFFGREDMRTEAGWKWHRLFFGMSSVYPSVSLVTGFVI
jgi:hypothetical protein